MFLICSVHIHKPPGLKSAYNCIYIEVGKMSDVRLEFPASDGFGWDENKSDANLPKHGIAFAEASEAFDGAVVVTRSDRNHEERWVAVGKSHGRMVTIVFTVRNQVIRIISARHPRPNERRAYREASLGRAPQGKD
jgi:uncharacterized protein